MQITDAQYEQILHVVEDRLRFNTEAHGKAWAGERGDTRFLVPREEIEKALRA